MSGRRWRLRHHTHQLWLVESPGPPPPGGRLLEPDVAARLVALWAGTDAWVRRAVDEIGGAVFGPSTRALEQRVAPASLDHALRSGTLRAYRASIHVGILRPAIDAEAEVVDAPLATKTTWIALKVLDDQDPPQPMRGLAYRLHLADGTSRDGRLDENGAARVEGIAPGECQITFPTLDGGDWKPI